MEATTDLDQIVCTEDIDEVMGDEMLASAASGILSSSTSSDPGRPPPSTPSDETPSAGPPTTAMISQSQIPTTMTIISTTSTRGAI